MKQQASVDETWNRYSAQNEFWGFFHLDMLLRFPNIWQQYHSQFEKNFRTSVRTAESLLRSTNATLLAKIVKRFISAYGSELKKVGSIYNSTRTKWSF